MNFEAIFCFILRQLALLSLVNTLLTYTYSTVQKSSATPQFFLPCLHENGHLDTVLVFHFGFQKVTCRPQRFKNYRCSRGTAIDVEARQFPCQATIWQAAIERMCQFPRLRTSKYHWWGSLPIQSFHLKLSLTNVGYIHTYNISLTMKTCWPIKSTQMVTHSLTSKMEERLWKAMSLWTLEKVWSNFGSPCNTI